MHEPSPQSISSPLPVRVYTPESAIQHPISLLCKLRDDISTGKELAWRLFTRDLKAQYRGSFLGYFWAFLPPLVGAATFIFLQSQGITNIQNTSIPYPAFAMIGTLLWQTFVDSIQSPLNSLNNARPMLAKLNFPREAILISGMYMVGFNVLIRLLLVLAVLVSWQIIPGISITLFPLMLFGIMLFGFAIGMLLLPIGGLYGDVNRGIPIISQFLMLLTPVVYPAQTTGFAGVMATWNPISPLIVTARDCITNQPLGQFVPAIITMILSLILAIFGLIAFRIVIPHLIARMGG